MEKQNNYMDIEDDSDEDLNKKKSKNKIHKVNLIYIENCNVLI